ncbi:MAG: hypothetical protein JXR59_05130 [Desulfuromonadaceae bacterium]|nr:hypothetical protein [Desulfuromonadaceae bacterium]
MKLLLPALIIFLLAFAGLSLGIMFNRRGITGGCSSQDPRLAGLDLKCTCGRDDAPTETTSCNNSVTLEVICPDEDPEKYQAILNQLDQNRESDKPDQA